jgi:hypothetical protein
MDGNDKFGDCVIAGAANLIAATDTEVHESSPAIPTADQAISQYKEITGCVQPGDDHDSGCVEADVLALWHRSGLFGGTKIAGYAPVEPSNLIAVHQTVAFYGGAYIGVQLPESAQQQFAAGEPWTVVPGSPIVGGHCVLIVGYTPTEALVYTWQKVIEVSYPWLASFMDECWATIQPAFVEAGGGPVLNLAALQADLSRLR